MKIAVTGVPGCGKTSIAPELAKFLKAELVGVNEFAKESDALKKEAGSKELVADLKLLRTKLEEKLKATDSVVLEGHLLCEIPLSVDAILVLRCDPRTLLKRYAERGYSKDKAEQNAMAELLDYCLIKAEQNYPAEKVVQIDCTEHVSRLQVFSKIESRKSDEVNWASLLEKPPFKGMMTRI